LARRRFNTSRPFFVAILALKPCVRLRLITLGWNVRFIGSATLIWTPDSKDYAVIGQTVYVLYDASNFQMTVDLNPKG
jgi:hypothetical protein